MDLLQVCVELSFLYKVHCFAYGWDFISGYIFCNAMECLEKLP